MPDAPDPDYDPDSPTIPLSGPRPTLSGSDVDLPLPEELAKLLPAGAYEVTGFLGAGGMGAVYKGMQIRLKRPVAIKIMRRDMGKDHDFEARFEREAQAMAKLNHPNIISVIDFGEAGPDYLFIVMELVDGTDLMDVIRSKQMTQEMALTLLPQICDALQFAHDHGIVHRDIKPSNIMLTRDGRVKMADFGLAKHFDHAESGFRTQTGTGMGTPDYAAPEQFDPTTPIDHRADIYALGVMIYQMITGALPRGVWRPPSQRAPVSTQWDAVVSRAMQNDPAERYQKASEVKTELSSIPLQSGRAASPKQSSPATPASGALGQSALPKSRTPLIAAAAAVAVLGIAAFFVFGKKEPQLTEAGRAAKQQANIVSPSPAPQASVSSVSPTGWQPLFTEKEWQTDWSGESDYRGAKLKSSREFVDKLMHLRNTNFKKPQPSPDGAVRARIVIREGGNLASVSARDSADHGRYQLANAPDFKTLTLTYTPKVGPSVLLGQYKLPKPSQLGEKLLIELRLQGDHLTGVLNGAAVIQAQDQRIAGAGDWGIAGADAWFESVEVQPLPAAAASPSPAPQVSKSSNAPAEPWQDVLRDPKMLNLRGNVKRTDEGLLFSKPGAAECLTSKVQRDGAIRLRTVFGGLQAILRGREGGDGFYLLQVVGGKITLNRWEIAHQRSTNLQGFPLREPLQPGQEYEIELRIEGQTLTAKFNGEILGTVTDGVFTQGGFGAAVTDKDAAPVLVKSLNFLDLDAPSKISMSPSTATKDAPFVNSLGMKFVPVPIGGGPTKDQRVLFGVWDVRVQDYAAYAAANPQANGSWKTQQKDGVPAGREPEHPVVGVSWEDAQGFCQWLTDKEHAEGKLPNEAKYRLPSDEEWSWAVGLPAESGATPAEKSGKNSVDFPWGKDWPPTKKVGNYSDESFHAKFSKDTKDKEKEVPWTKDYNDDYATTSPVGSFPANAYGLYDMGGNVWQWCEDWFDKDQKERVLRGASWSNSGRNYLLSSYRLRFTPGPRNGDYGFRCVLAPAVTAPQTPTAKPGISPLLADIEGRGIKLWDSPEKIPASSGARWNNGMVEMGDGDRLAWLGYSEDRSRNAILRASVRMNVPVSSHRPQLILRKQKTGDYYLLSVAPDTRAITLNAFVQSQMIQLGGWRLPRSYGPDEWLRVELRVIDHELTAVADGKVIATVKDKSVDNAGDLALTGQGAAFRDIEYIPLDKPATAVPATATKDAPLVNSLGMQFVPVPVGGGPTKGERVLFGVWDVRVQDYAAYAAANPKVDGSWKTRNRDGVPVGREPEHPVTSVSWEDAQAFCQWLTAKETGEGKLPPGMKYRLPSDEEWSWAAGLPSEQGATPAEKSRKNSVDLPWGKDYPPTKKVGNYADETFHGKFPKDKEKDQPWIKDYTDGYATTSPVGSFPANAYGLYDMGGNVWQWCEDWFDKDQKDRVLRGASWPDHERRALLSSFRASSAPGSRNNNYGFRCVLAPATSTPPAAGTKSGLIGPNPTQSDLSNPASGTPEAATKDVPLVNSLGMKFVPVPIGGGATKGERVLFGVWDVRVQDYAAYAAANPQADGSWKTQNRNGVPAGREPEHPVVGVSWEDAQAFCQWLTVKETAEGKLPPGLKYRLPSDEEWSWAVGLPPEIGATPEEKNRKNNDVDFPWGKDWPPTNKVGNYADETFHAKFPLPDAKEPERIKNEWIKGYDDGYATTSPVGRFPANAYGLYDIGGNVWQWCEDWFDTSHKDHVLRGASWIQSARGLLLSSNRSHYAPGYRGNLYGFRCVLAESSPASSADLPTPAPAGSGAATKFPAGQWVKVFTKPGDLPAELRKPDSGVKWEDGWIRLGQQRQWLNLPKNLDLNYGVRLRFRRNANPEEHARIAARVQPENIGLLYSLRLGATTLSILKRQETDETSTTLVDLPCQVIPKIGEEGTLEFYVMNQRLIGRTGPTFVASATDDRYVRGPAQIIGGEDIRDIEVINLDGLPEAEALRLLGVDEKGNDLRGKTGANTAP